MNVKPLRKLAALNVGWLLAGCGDPNSAVICGADSKESVFARSLSESQLETLYADSMKLLTSADLQREYDDRPGYPPIPTQFSYLNSKGISTFSSDVEGVRSEVSILLKGCLDEFIQLSVDKGEIVLSYGLGGAPNVGEEILWSANKEASLKAVSSLAAKEDAVAVSFEFPDKPPVFVGVTMSEAVQLTGVKQPYAVEFWVLGALSKGELKYTIEHIEGKRTITAVGSARNGPAGTWVYFVDGVRSKDYINTQTAPKVRSIRFAYEKVRDA